MQQFEAILFCAVDMLIEEYRNADIMQSYGVEMVYVCVYTGA